jgi:hypothetical protein
MSIEKRSDLPPAVQEFLEVQDRRNDPGAFLGGNIHPALRARRPNPYGYVVLGWAGVSAMFGVYYFRFRDWPAVVFFLVLTVVSFLAGVRLLRRPKASQVSHDQS